MSILDFKNINETISRNSKLKQKVSVSSSLKDLLNFSTNDTSYQYEQSNQYSPTYTNTQVWAPFLALSSPGASSSPTASPTVVPKTTAEQAQKDSGGAGINANTIIVGVVIIAALYFGINYLTETDPTKNAAEVAKGVKK
jgi:hypothetical protein